MKRYAGLCAVVIGIVLSGCGGGGEETTTSPAAPDGVEAPSGGATTPGLAGAFPEFRECMADQGFDIPATGGPPPALLADPEAQIAFQECAKFLPAGASGAH